jgi:hypothetical protein
MGDAGAEGRFVKYEWQKGSPEARAQLMADRRDELLATDMAANPRAQEEWIALLMERQSGGGSTSTGGEGESKDAAGTGAAEAEAPKLPALRG